MNRDMKIKVKYFTDIEPIIQQHDCEWYDLRAAEDVFMAKGDFRLIPLGVAIELPKGQEAIVAPRSSTFKNFGIIMTNSIGVIDNSYSGDDDQWHFPALAIRETMIHKGDRICQFRILYQQPQAVIETVDHLGNANRGGIGSTGIK